MAESGPPQSEISPKVPVYQEKSALFRVVHADGAWWSVNPRNDLHLVFYSERAPIPKVVYFGPDKEGTWNELIEEREVKKGWFREMEVDIVLTPTSAATVQEAIVRYLEYIKPPVTASTPEPPKQK
jgi:hypothetical protein